MVNMVKMISDEVYLLEKIKCILKLHATDHNSKRKQIPTIVLKFLPSPAAASGSTVS